MPKKQLEYLFYTGVRRFSILGGGRGRGRGGIWTSLILTGLLGAWGHNAFNFFFLGGVLAPAAQPTLAPAPMFYSSLAHTNAIFTCALSFFKFTSINESISSNHYQAKWLMLFQSLNYLIENVKCILVLDWGFSICFQSLNYFIGQHGVNTRLWLQGVEWHLVLNGSLSLYFLSLNHSIGSDN